MVRDYYVKSLRAVGANALILPPAKEADIIAEYLQVCNGLLFSGGGILIPALGRDGSSWSGQH